MNARGSTEVIVATIGLSMGALSENLFTMIVAMAVVTTMAMPPTLRWALGARADAQGGEGAAGARGIRGERLRPEPRAPLVAVDESPNGRFAARLAGLLAGPRGMPTTVLPLSAKPARARTRAGSSKGGIDSGEHDRAGDGVRATAEASKPHRIAKLRPQVDVTVRALATSREEAVAREAKKGYGLLS